MISIPRMAAQRLIAQGPIRTMTITLVGDSELIVHRYMPARAVYFPGQCNWARRQGW